MNYKTEFLKPSELETHKAPVYYEKMWEHFCLQFISIKKEYY